MTTKALLRYIFLSRLRWRILIILISFIAAILGLLGPILQKDLIDQLLGIHSSDFHPLTLVIATFFTLLLGQGLSFLSNYLGNREAIILQKDLSEKLYQKTLLLRPDAMGGRQIGEIVSLYATDIMGATVFLEQTLPTGASTLFPLILAPMALYWMYGFELYSVLTIMVLVISINTFLAFMQSKFFLKFKQLAAERTGLVNEWIQNLRTLRILGWIESFEQKIFAKRITETQNRVSMVTNGQLMNSISSSVTFLINIVSIIALVAHLKSQNTGKVISPGELLSLLWILGVFLTRPFRQMPWFFTFGFDGLTSAQRLAGFFSLNNISHQFPTSTTPERKKLDQSGPEIEVYGMNLRIGNKEILKDISFDIKPQELIAVVGEVGSGKSSLLLSLMGETSANFKKYKIGGQNILSYSQPELSQHFSYVPQEGFIMSATLRDNIAFDYQVSSQQDEHISQSLQKAQFRLNIEGLPDGLNTEIGERGVNLSGGQKQRINLARADFFESPIILLDDSFSAVDVDTEKRLVEELIYGRWANKTRIIATHRLSLLKIVNRVLFMVDGQIKEFAPLDELFMKSPEFREFTSSLEKKELKEKKNAKIH